MKTAMALLKLLGNHAVSCCNPIVLNAIGAAIRCALTRVEESSSYDAEWKSVVVDEEVANIEDLLGASLIVCQSSIRAITNAAIIVRQRCIDNRRVFRGFGGTDQSVRAIGAQVSSELAIVGVDAIWALADYFAHRDTWMCVNWSELQELPKTTIDVLVALDLTPGAVGNLRKASCALGNPTYDRIDVFREIVSSWAQDVYAICCAELGVTFSSSTQSSHTSA
jgi:hypothetical protein